MQRPAGSNGVRSSRNRTQLGHSRRNDRTEKNPCTRDPDIVEISGGRGGREKRKKTRHVAPGASLNQAQKKGKGKRKGKKSFMGKTILNWRMGKVMVAEKTT